MDGPVASANNGLSRAERFEDEKRRIVDSLFMKKDQGGSLLESYITHIRIVEDAAYPSSPPPPTSSQDAKKPRVIIVAVRKSGRVSMHKARENANGSFSIGKTWHLDELSMVQSFNGPGQGTALEQQQKLWAGGSGFVVTMGKPYYWQANSEKEKQFFVASLVKIYTKYTGGKVPDLVGFDDRERGQILGSAQRVQQAAPPRPLPQSTDEAAVVGAPPPRAARPPRETSPLRPKPLRTPDKSEFPSTYDTSATASAPVPSSSAQPSLPGERVPLEVRGPRPAPMAQSSHASTTQSPLPLSAVTSTPKPLEVAPKASLATEPQSEPPMVADSEPKTPMPEVPPEPQRPGLGPMIKKKSSRADVANKLFIAATAVNAFKPRAGGAAERLRGLNNNTNGSNGPDGITSVVPAPSLLRVASNDSTRSASTANTTTTTTTLPSGLSKETVVDEKVPEPIPEVKVAYPPLEAKKEQSDKIPDPPARENANGSPAKEKQEARRKKPTSERAQKELTALGIDPIILDGRAADFIQAMDDFGWVGEGVHSRNIDEMQEDIERQINKAQAGDWLARLDEEDDRVAAISTGLDAVIAECEELDGLLTLYSVELGTLTDDVAYIEAQSQGLQVQTANQKLLQKEVQSLLETISISSDQLADLSNGSLESTLGLQKIEAALTLLYKAMLTIDPSLSTTAASVAAKSGGISGRGMGDSEIGNMLVLQEKKHGYKLASVQFLERLRENLKFKFAVAFDATTQAITREGQLRRGLRGKIDAKNHELAWDLLWKWSPIMLFAREIDHAEWEHILRAYESKSKPVSQGEFGVALSAWKRTPRRPPPTADEAEYIFTSPVEKQAEGLGRKLTVKAAPSLGKFRSMGDIAGRNSADKKPADTSPKAADVFAIALEEMSTVIFMEQNFIVEMFHISSIESNDFVDCVAMAAPDSRYGGDLRKPKPMDPNRDLAKKVVQSMEEIYSFWPSEMSSLVQWAIEVDPTQGVGVLAAMERKMIDLEESSQEYLSRTLQRLHSQLSLRFNRFLDDQIRAIEDTKVKIKKRKGVIAFIRVFPQFSQNLENMLTSAEDLDIRETVNNAYTRIIKTMFDSLKVIARENPSATTSGSSLADPEAKEALNYQILLIENMKHYISEVETRNNPVLEDWKQKAERELQEHLSLYVGAVIRRPLGKLLDVLESTESRIASLPSGMAPSTIANNQSHRKLKFQTVLAAYDSREIRKGIEELKIRVQKHFSHPEDQHAERALVVMVLGECQKSYEHLEKRITDISTEVYEGDASYSWTKADLTAFRR